MGKAKPPDLGGQRSITALFRYRNLVKETLEEHQKIISQGTPCWWGWWKRPSEPPRCEVWEAIQKELDERGIAYVGLFDSGESDPTRAVHRAKVTKIIRRRSRVEPFVQSERS